MLHVYILAKSNPIYRLFSSLMLCFLPGSGYRHALIRTGPLYRVSYLFVAGTKQTAIISDYCHLPNVFGHWIASGDHRSVALIILQ